MLPDTGENNDEVLAEAGIGLTLGGIFHRNRKFAGRRRPGGGSLHRPRKSFQRDGRRGGQGRADRFRSGFDCAGDAAGSG
ncbi:MAG: LPXTG cell wall anchor domain-containing protein [Acidobacteriia bacterium]|nr:LPXTG cell wall anchor domain-containing protein [Terriglobia bacterium]